MSTREPIFSLGNLKNDLPAGVVVFFVALPLCLGIALTSGAPLFSGIIAGIVGGVVVGALSGSRIGVSGPAAGLAAIVLTAIGTLGTFENFLLAVVLAGGIQILFGILKAGVIGYYFPSAVIKGMLTGIGIIIVLKQIPHFFGYDADPEGDMSYFQVDGHNTFSEMFLMLNNLGMGTTIISALSLTVLIFWDKVLVHKAKIFQIIQGPFVVVVLGIMYVLFTQGNEEYGIGTAHLVSVPIPEDISSFADQFRFPNYTQILNLDIWIVAFTMALVASLETLLCVEATDKIDPDKHVTPTNRELLAQGVGNILSGMIGGLPVTQVIVRSSANIQSGGKSKLSAIIHGLLLLGAVAFIPNLLNLIPLGVLAAILLVVGYKLAKPTLFKSMYKLGWKQFVPFITTIVGLVFTDLLTGISLGLMVGLIVILIKNYQNSHFLHIEDKSNGTHKIKMTLAEEVNFINKGAIMKELNALPEDTELTLDIINNEFMDYDIKEILEEYIQASVNKKVTVKLLTEKGMIEKPLGIIEYLK